MAHFNQTFGDNSTSALQTFRIDSGRLTRAELHSLISRLKGHTPFINPVGDLYIEGLTIQECRSAEAYVQNKFGKIV